MNIFDWLVRQLDRTEVSAITFISKVIPIIIPVIPAQIGYKNVTNKVYGLGWSWQLGWSYAIAIEGLGYAAIYIGMRFWEHNRKLKETDEKAPILGVVVIYVIYLCVTLFVNALLDYKSGLETYKVVATAMISLLSVPGGLLMGIAAIHTERTIARERAEQEAADKKAEEKEQRRLERERIKNEQRLANEHRTNTPNERQPKNVRPNRTPLRTNIPQPANEQTNGREGENERPMGFPTNDEQQAGERVMAYIEQVQRTQGRTPGQSEIARAVSVSKSTADKWLKARPQ